MSEREKRIAEIRGRLSSEDAWIDIFEREDDAERTRYIMVAPADLEWALGEIERLERVLDGLCMFVETAVGLGDTKIPNTLGWVVADARKALKGGDANG